MPGAKSINHRHVQDWLHLTLAGVFDAPSARTTHSVQLDDPSSFNGTSECPQLIDMSMLIVAAAIPAVAIHQGIVRHMANLPIHARTRLDLLGEHGRELGGAVVVGETRMNEDALECYATASQAAFALEIGERLTVPAIGVHVSAGGAGVLIHASLCVHTNRGAELVADVMARLWNTEAAS